MSRRARDAMRVALSDYVLCGLSAGFGLFVIAALTHVFLGSFASAAASVGAITIIPPDQVAPKHRKAWQLVPAAVIGLPLFFGVQLLRDDPLRLGLLLVPAAFIAFLGAAWGKRGIPVSISAMLAIVFSMAAPEGADHDTPLRTSAYFAVGAGAYLVYATIANVVLNARYRVQAIADVLLAVARLMRIEERHFKPGGVHDTGPVAGTIRAQATLADQLQSARDMLLESPRTRRRQQLAAMLIQTLEMRDHLLACELDLDVLVSRRDQEDVLRELRRVLTALAAEIEDIADALLLGRRPVAFESHRPRLASLPFDATGDADSAVENAVGADGAPSSALLARGLASRVGYLDDEAMRIVALARGDAQPNLALVRATWQMFVSPTSWSLRPFFSLWRWDAPPLRHAIRAACAIGVAYSISLALPWGTHPYWILLTIVVVLRGSFAQTIERRNARMIGTLVGGLLAQALLVNDPPAWVLLVVLPVAQGIAHAFGVRRYVVTAVAATVVALVQAHLLSENASLTFEAVERIVDTLMGVGIAWAFSFLLPSWESTQIPALVNRVLVAHARHAKLALGLGQLEAVDNQPELEWRLARREVYDALSALVQATQRSLAEPRGVRPPFEPLSRFVARSYQLLAQLTAVKTMLLLRRGRLHADQLALPLQSTANAIAATLSSVGTSMRPHEGSIAPVADETAATASADLPDPFAHDLSPWLLRRLGLARDIALQVGGDATDVRDAIGPRARKAEVDARAARA